MKICWLFSVAKCLTGLWNLAYTMKISYQTDKTIAITQETRSWVVCWDGVLCYLYLLLDESGEPLVRCPEPEGSCGRWRKLWQQVQLSGSGLGEGAHSGSYGSSNSTIFFMMGGHCLPLVYKSQLKVRGWFGVITRNYYVSSIVSWSWKLWVFDGFWRMVVWTQVLLSDLWTQDNSGSKW